MIRTNPEFQTNKDHNRPTNRLCTALLSRDRLAFILRYALVYVAEPGGIQNTSCATRSSSPPKRLSAS
ncbi:hypothetical protein ACVV4J_09090 [Escherichia coli]